MKIPVGYCGLCCAECAIYLACHPRGPGQQVSSPQFSPGVLSTTTPQKNIVCEGCQSDDASCYGRDCEIRRCARAKAITFCHECPEYVCEKLDIFYNDHLVYHGQARTNLEEIQHIGLTAWLEKKQQKS